MNFQRKPPRSSSEDSCSGPRTNVRAGCRVVSPGQNEGPAAPSSAYSTVIAVKYPGELLRAEQSLRPSGYFATAMVGGS